MHEEKVALTKNQIAALRRAAETRSIQDIFVVACGGSLATLYPILYILDRETNAVHVSSVNAAEFFHNPPHRLGDHSLVILNSQSGTTPETVSAARLAHAGRLLRRLPQYQAPLSRLWWIFPFTIMTIR